MVYHAVREAPTYRNVVYQLTATVTVTVTVTEALVLHPPARRPRAHHRVNLYLGARRQNETEMFLDHDETSPSIAAVSAPSALGIKTGLYISPPPCLFFSITLETPYPIRISIYAHSVRAETRRHVNCYRASALLCEICIVFVASVRVGLSVCLSALKNY